MKISFPRTSQKKQAEIAIDNHLYVDGWTMIDEYSEILDTPNKNIVMVIAFCDKKPVAACTYDKSKLKVAVFVKAEYRKKAIGVLILNKLLQRFNLKRNEVLAGNGVSGSDVFFYKK